MMDVRHQQVDVSVSIEVFAGDAHAGDGHTAIVVRAADPRRHVLEGAVAPVAPQEARRLIVGDVQVDPAVAVEVARQDPEAVAGGPGDARPLGYVLEPAVAEIAIEPVVRWRLVGHRVAVVAHAQDRVADRLAGQRPVDVPGDVQV